MEASYPHLWVTTEWYGNGSGQPKNRGPVLPEPWTLFCKEESKHVLSVERSQWGRIIFGIKPGPNFQWTWAAMSALHLNFFTTARSASERCYSTKNWLSSRLLTSVVTRGMVFPSWYKPLPLQCLCVVPLASSGYTIWIYFVWKKSGHFSFSVNYENWLSARIHTTLNYFNLEE